MRIGIFTTHYTITQETGSCMYFVEQLQNRHEIFIVCENCDEELRDDHVIQIPSLSPKKLVEYFNNKTTNTSFMQSMRQLNLDLIQATEQFKTGLLAHMVSERLNIPLAYSVKDYYASVEESYHMDERFQLDKSVKKIFEMIDLKLVSDCNTFIVYDDKTRQRLEKENGNRFVYHVGKKETDYLDEIYAKTVHQFNEVYVLQSVKFKADTVLVSIQNAKHNLDILISIDQYVDRGLKKGMEVDEDLISDLLKDELLTHAYLGVLNKLKYKDRTVQEVKDYLRKEHGLDFKQIEEMTNLLLEKGYLNDEHYAENLAERLKLQLKGNRLIHNELLKKGISLDVIHSVLEKLASFDEDESELAYRYAVKTAKSIKNKSMSMKRMFIRTKLLQRGYNNDIIDGVMNRLDFSEDTENEVSVLRKSAEKAYNRYHKKYEGKQLRNQLTKYLMSQGFRYESIIEVLQELKIEDE